MNDENGMKTTIDIDWLYVWIASHPAKLYEDYPLIEGTKTKDEALRLLGGLKQKGVTRI
jgi:hypothetical protein